MAKEPNFSGHALITALVDETGAPITAANPLEVNASVSASTVAKATAAAPTYIEGDTAAPLSVDLAGGLRITGTINATSATTNTAAAPSYVEGSSNAFSGNLSGDLRVIAKQSGTWVIGAGSALIGKVGIDQTTPGTTNAVDVTNFPVTVDVNSGVKSNSTIRVVLATDQPALTNKLLVTPDLPSGASTAAKQPALGTAGTASADVISVQGIASMTALKVDGSAVTQPVSIATAPVLVAGSAIIGKVGIDQTTPGTTNAISATNLPTTVDTNSGNKSASTLRTLIATDALAVPLWGHGATAATVPANASLNGARAATANPTAVTDGQMVALMADKEGKLVAVGAIRTLKGSQKTSLSNTTAETTIVTAVASTFLDLYGLILANTGSTTTKVDIRDTTSGSIIATIEVPTLETRGFMLPVDSAIPQTTVNTNWTAQCASATTAMEITALYVKNI